MPANAPLTGYTATFPADVVLDSGQLYIGATVFGAFAGGLKFDPGITWRAVEFDGKRSAVKGLDRKAMMNPKISGTCIQLSTSNVAELEPGVTMAASGGYTGSTSYWPKDAGVFLASGDYLTDVRAVWMRGDNTYVQVRFPVGVCVKYDMVSKDGAEIAIALEIEARLDMSVSGAQIGDAPYRIEYLATP